ncbi:MAG TPA: stalk domain-containing protein, partial [Clostridia bacterium]|nr:stalk domain-containing protein [Clostridia bacterium]
LKVGYWTPVPVTDYEEVDETVTFTGPLSYMSGTRGFDGDGYPYYMSGEWYHFRITKAGAIGASIDTTMWQRQDPAYPLDANNACCKTFTKTFTVCEIKSCTTTSVQLTGGAQTSASAITVGGKSDLVVSVDPTGAPADLFCGCNSKIVHIYMTNSCGVTQDAFTVDTYGGGTPVTVDELWYNGIPESLASYGATATCPAPTGYSADGTVLFQQTTPGIVAVDNCTTLTFKGVTINFPTGTDCGYRLVVQVFGEQRGYDQCGVLCPTFPFISESINPISINPVTVTKTATATIYEAGIDPTQILAGVPATVEITDPAFSSKTSSKWEDATANWSFSFKAAGDDTFHAFEYWGLTAPTVSSIDNGYRFSSFCINRAGTIEIYTYSYNTDNDCKQLEELVVDVEVVMPVFGVKIELLDGTMLENDNILTSGFGETVYVTATDPRTDGTHDFTTDSSWHLTAAGRTDSCYLRTALVCLSSPTGCIGCAGGNALTITAYDNPCLEGAGTVRLSMVTACGNLKISDFTVTDPTVTVDPATVAFTIPASATHVTFTVKDAHGHGAPGITVSISGDMSPSTGASGYSWTAGSVETGKDPMGEADWAFVPPFSGQYFVSAIGSEYCTIRANDSETLVQNPPLVWTTKYAKLGATITAKYQAPVVDTTAPVVTVTAGIDGSTVGAEVLALTGKVTDNVGVSQLYVGFNKVDVLPDGSFMTNVKLAAGENTITVVAYDAAGNKGTAAVKVTYTAAVDTKTVLILTIGADIVSVNGKATSIDAAPEIVASRTFVPMRFIAESFGATVEWLPETQGITITLGDHTIGLQIGNATAVIDGTIVSLPAAPYIKNGRTMVPLRVISEAFGGDVVWDPAARTITITYIP